MLFKHKTSGPQWLIAGLGNPGKKYENTRHNAGCEALDAVADVFGIYVRRSRFDALCGEGTADGRRVLLIKPQTFMNLSGKSVMKAAGYYGIPPEKVLVLCDDVALDPGILRIRLFGSDGGHNGLKSIITFIGQNFPRIRIGVGAKPRAEYDMADWVLSRLTAAEHECLSARHGDIVSAARLLLAEKSGEAMALYNGKGRPPAQKEADPARTAPAANPEEDEPC
jgi:PTH1 family peptidyl-tRNA hydrolase